MKLHPGPQMARRETKNKMGSDISCFDIRAGSKEVGVTVHAVM